MEFTLRFYSVEELGCAGIGLEIEFGGGDAAGVDPGVGSLAILGHGGVFCVGGFELHGQKQLWGMLHV